MDLTECMEWQLLFSSMSSKVDLNALMTRNCNVFGFIDFYLFNIILKTFFPAKNILRHNLIFIDYTFGSSSFQ